jgi:large subunit ribosomal protein L29
MKAKELMTKDAAALNEELGALLKTQFNLRMQKAMQQLNDVNQLRKVRREIARVRTVMHQKAGVK